MPKQQQFHDGLPGGQRISDDNDDDTINTSVNVSTLLYQLKTNTYWKKIRLYSMDL